MKVSQNEVKEIFRKKGTCSQTFYHILNYEFENTDEEKEKASDLLAGGLLSTGHQCGMLWGVSLAVGAESYRRFGNSSQAITTSITVIQNILKSFTERTGTINCREITGCNLKSVFGMMKMMAGILVKGIKNNVCFNLAGNWAPEAVDAANKGFSEITNNSTPQISCASEVLKKSGASEEEIITVSGFAGGMGLSGNACGALGAVVWLRSLRWIKNNPGKKMPYFRNPESAKILKSFNSETNSEILCRKICGKNFETPEQHSEFINNGGCAKLINILAEI